MARSNEPTPARRSTGRRDVLVIATVVAVLIGLGARTHMFNVVDRAIQGAAIGDDLVGLLILLLAGAAAIAVASLRRTRRAGAERAAAAEERYRTLVERVPAIAYSWDTAFAPGSAPADYISPQIEVLVGVPPSAWLDDPTAWAAHVHPDDVERVTQAWTIATSAGTPFSQEYRLRRADGAWRWVRDEANPVGPGLHSAPIYQGVIVDITERHEAEARLRTAEHRWRSLLAELPLVAYEGGLDEQGHIGDRWIAAGISDLLGIPVDEWLDDPDAWDRVIHPDDVADVLRAWNTLLADGTLFDQRYRMRHRDGHDVWVHDRAVRTERDGRTVILGAFADITARRAAETALELAQGRFRTLVEQLPAITFIEDPTTGEVLYVSPQVEEVYGYTADEWTADTELWKARLHPDDRDRVLASNDADTGDLWNIDYRSITRDGRTVWVHNDARLVRDPDGQPSYWQGVVYDITERKHAEERLRDAEERFRTLVEQLPVAVYTDAVDDVSTALYISPRYEDLTGYSPEQRLHDPDLWVRMLHPEDRDRVLAESVATNETGEPFDTEYRIVAADGRTVWLHDHAVQVVARDGSARWHGILQDITDRIMDITERKHAELALRDAERRYRTLIESIPAVTYIDAMEEPWSTVYVSPQVASIFGFTPEEWIEPGLWIDQVHPDDALRARAAVESHASTNEPFDLEYRMRHADGRWLWVRDQAFVVTDEEGSPLFSQGVMYDITDAKVAEERLRDAEERYRAIVEHIPAAIYLDRPDGAMETVYISPQIFDIAGITPSQWMEDPTLWLTLMHPQDRDAVERSYLEAVTAHEPWRAEYRLRTPDGRTVWLHDETTFLHGPEGEPLLLQGVLFDITERKLAEQALRESEQREREAAERLRALDDMKNTFLAAVSHELRSPLTSILGLALTLERSPDIHGRDRDDLLERLAANARKLDRLLKDLLDIDRLRRGIVEPQYRVSDVAALARRTVEHLDALAGREVIVTTDSVVMPIDPAKIERIVENLLMNAVRHTDDDRRIWLTVGPHESGVRISVEDDGPGVPRELHDVIFEPFRQGPTASPHSPGTGIGLSLVARFAELHGGQAWVGEREGGGAAFHVVIPGDAEGGSRADAG